MAPGAIDFDDPTTLILGARRLKITPIMMTSF